MNRRHSVPLAALILAAALLAACGSGDADQPASTLSRAERDSVLADSPLPGAATVQGALDLSDSASARAQRLDEYNNK